MTYRQVNILKSSPRPGTNDGEASELSSLSIFVFLSLTLQGLQFSSSFLSETSAGISHFQHFSHDP